jgi:hypothetical protein
MIRHIMDIFSFYSIWKECIDFRAHEICHVYFHKKPNGGKYKVWSCADITLWKEKLDGKLIKGEEVNMMIWIGVL